MKQSRFRLLYSAVFVLLLAGCGGSSNTPTTPDETDDPPVETEPVVITGIAAAGAALDGATVEIIDASGNLVEVGDVLTGTDGSYQVELPDGTELPVVVRVTPPGGTPLLNIIPASEDGTDIVANINPVTNLVTNSVLADADPTDGAAIAGALATVDTTTIEATGDEVVERLLGNSVTYSSFATDPAFVARSTEEGASTPTAADAILDTIARQASAAGSTLDAQLKSLNERADPPRLLQEPEFQVSLVGEMLKGGTSSGDLETRLAEVGAIADAVEGEADVFRTVIETVPALIETVRTDATGIADDADLLDVAADAAIDILATTLQEKKDRYGTNNDGLVSALGSTSLKDTVTKVVQSSVVPVLTTFAGSGSDATVKANLTKVVKSVSTQASTVASAFTYNDTSTDVSNLVSGFVSAQVTAPTSTEELESAASGSTQAVNDVGDVNTAKSSIEAFATENADLIEGSVEELIETVPPGTWNTSKWDGFNWG